MRAGHEDRCRLRQHDRQLRQPVSPGGVRAGVDRAEVPATKAAVRQALVDQGREDDWTEMQGYVYGTRMLDAEPFPGVLDFFRRAVAQGRSVAIVSHKTRHPYRGPRYDLHQAAHDWLDYQGFYDPADRPGARPRLLRADQAAKLDQIARLGCTHFIDDLPEILGDPGFPGRVARSCLTRPAITATTPASSCAVAGTKWIGRFRAARWSHEPGVLEDALRCSRPWDSAESSALKRSPRGRTTALHGSIGTAMRCF